MDLIFVFLDPHEQALGSRTMEVVKMLNVGVSMRIDVKVDHYDKMCYYLTKIDTLNSIADLMKVSNQTTQVGGCVISRRIESCFACKEYPWLGTSDNLSVSGLWRCG